MSTNSLATSGSIHTASDVALNSPTNGQVLGYNATLGVWQNQTGAGGNSGAQALSATTVKTAGYTAAAGDLIPVDATSGACTVTLPTAPADKSRIAVKKIDSSANIVTIGAGGSDVFNKTGGSTSLTLTLQNQSLSLQYSSGSSIWYVVGDDLPLSQLDGRYTQKANNLSDLASTSSARTNLGLSAAATMAVGTTTGTVAAGNDSRLLGSTKSKAIADGSTDQSTVITNELSALSTAGGGVLELPAGVIVGAVTLYSNTWLKGQGASATTLKLPASSTATAVITSNNFLNLANTDRNGSGEHQFIISDLSIDGNKAAQATLVLPPAGLVLVAGTSGSLTAGNVPVRVTSVSSTGTESDPTDATQVTVSASGSIAVSWPAASGAASYNIYAENSGAGREYCRLVGNSTSTNFTITSFSSSAAICPHNGLNKTSVMGIALYGFDWTIRNVVVHHTASTGIYTEFDDTVSGSNPYTYDSMEARIDSVKIHHGGHHGLVHNGPHDSQVKNVMSFFNRSSTTTDASGSRGISTGALGNAVHFFQSHAYGNHSYAWFLGAENYLVDCVGEGANIAQLLAQGDGLQVTGGQYFKSSGNLATSIGLQIGNGVRTPKNIYVDGAEFEDFDNASGGAAVLFQAVGTGLNLTARVRQDTGSAVYLGSIPADANVNLYVTGATTAVSFAYVPYGYRYVNPMSLGIGGVNSTVQLLVAPNAGTIKSGVFIAGSASPSVNVLEVQNSTFTPVFSVNYQGLTTIAGSAGLTVNPAAASQAFLVKGANDVFNINTTSKDVELPRGTTFTQYTDAYTTKTLEIDGTGKILFGSALDVNIYRGSTAQLKTDSQLMVAPGAVSSGLTVNNGTVDVLNVNTTAKSLDLPTGTKLTGYTDAYTTKSILIDASNGYIKWGSASDTTLYRVGSNSLKTDGALSIGGPLIERRYSQTLATAGTLNFDASVATVFVANLQANCTSSTITNGSIGQRITITWAQDATGGRTYAWDTNCRFAANAQPAQADAVVCQTTVTFQYMGTHWSEMSRAVNVPT